MMDELDPRPPTTPCAVRIRLADGGTLDGFLWLLPSAAHAGGVTPAESILDGSRDFVAVGLPRGGSVLVGREAIRTVELDADGEGVEPMRDDGASLDVVTLTLDSGEEISGVLRAVAREGANRMSDVFNDAPRFVPLLMGDRLLLVAKRRIARVSF
jgi:hypothetical protein